MNTDFPHYCTIGQLKEFIEQHKLSDDTTIVMQRVSDHYFDNVGGWKENSIKKKGEWYHNFLEHNRKIDEKIYLDKDNYPNIKPDSPFLIKYTEAQLESSLEEYYPCWCPIYFDNDFLYLCAFY